MSLQSKFVQVTNPMLQVFSPQEMDNSIIDFEYCQKYNQDGSDIQNIDKPLYEFVVTDRDSWMNLSESFIEARVSIVRADNGAAITGGNIALVNNGFNLFKRAEYQYDGKGVLETVEYPGHKAQILGLINNSQDAEKGLTNEFWYPDRFDAGLTDTSASPLVYTIAGVDKVVATTNANVLQIAGADADNAVITVTFKGYPVTFQFGNASATIAQLDKLGGGNPDEIDYAGILAGQVLTLYANGLPLKLFNNGVPAYIFANATPEIVLSGIVGVNRVITAKFDYSALENINSNSSTRKLKFYNPTTSTYDKVATIYLPLRKLFGFFDYNRIVMKGATHKLSLYRNDIGRALFRDATAVNGKIKFWGLSWWIPYCVPRPELDMALNEKLLKGAEVALGFYDYKYYDYPTVLEVGQSSQIQWTIQSDITKPVKVFLWFQNEQANSEQTVNSMKFDKTFVQTARCIINSNVHYPKEEYQLDFTDAATTQNISRAYLEFLRAGGKAFNSGSGPSISLEEYKELYPILVFDLSKQDSSKVYQYVGTNTLQVKLTFGAQHTQRLKLYAYVQNERVATLRGAQNKLDVLTS